MRQLGAHLLGPPYMEIFINRNNVMEDMLKLYEDPTVPLTGVKVEFLGEQGDDFGGLTKELYTLVWRRLSDEYFRGEAAIVPFLPLYKHDDHMDDFLVIGRILSHTVALLQYLPPRISRCTLLSVALGSHQISENVLMQDFRCGS
jgi:hypothetical protein